MIVAFVFVAFVAFVVGVLYYFLRELNQAIKDMED